MNDGKSGGEHKRKPIDHVKRKRGAYEPKSPVSPEERKYGPAELARISASAEAFRLMTHQERDQETRRRKSEGMKEFNRKTGRNTALGNLISRRSRKPK